MRNIMYLGRDLGESFFAIVDYIHIIEMSVPVIIGCRQNAKGNVITLHFELKFTLQQKNNFNQSLENSFLIKYVKYEDVQ